MVKKFISEVVGTMLLVLFGCGTAVAANKYVSTAFGGSPVYGLAFNMVLIALAFGLILMALAYTIGKVSGAHVNPAVSVAMLIDGRISVFECIYYIVGQILGSVGGAAVLGFLLGSYESLGANGFDTASALGASVVTLPVALVLEAILTFVFVLVVLTVSADSENKSAGLIIGLALALVHILGLPFTGTSVNPARSIGPAILTNEAGTLARSQLWVFIVGPLIGGVLAALFYKFIIAEKEVAKKRK